MASAIRNSIFLRRLSSVSSGQRDQLAHEVMHIFVNFASGHTGRRSAPE
jgi:hypothetical protein